MLYKLLNYEIKFVRLIDVFVCYYAAVNWILEVYNLICNWTIIMKRIIM